MNDAMIVSDYHFRGLTQELDGKDFTRKQKELLQIIHENQGVIVNKCRQTGVSVAISAYALWYALSKNNVSVVILCPTDRHAVEFSKGV